jgi:hypothetical protein
MGSLFALAGLWMLIASRRKKLQITDSGGSMRPTKPTRLFIAFVLVLIGYHTAIWGFPEQLTPVQLNRHCWYIWIMIGILGIGLSLLMDHVDKKPSTDGDSGA